MTRLALLRHGRTEWNESGRMQGRHDTMLTARARETLATLCLPPELSGFIWRTSPLRRAVDTAALLGIAEARPDPRLIEMDWGGWEGRTLAELRAEHGTTMAGREAEGLDFKPPGGESPREVQARLAPLLAEIAASGRPAGAVTHKGVIRAILALATAWDMRGKAPLHLDWHACHLFELDRAGRLSPLRLNVALLPRAPR
jgi:probable phosphoglycerate mutase